MVVALVNLFFFFPSFPSPQLEAQVNALLADPATGDGPGRNELMSMQGKLSEQRDALSSLMDQKRQLEALHSQLTGLADAEENGGGVEDSGGIEELLAGFMNVFQAEPTALHGLDPALNRRGGTGGDISNTTIEELSDDAPTEHEHEHEHDGNARRASPRGSPRVRFESPPSHQTAGSSASSPNAVDGASATAGVGVTGDDGSIALPPQFANISSQELLQTALQNDDLAAELVSAGLDPAVLSQLGEQQAELADLQRQLAEVRQLSAIMDEQHAAGGDDLAAAITDGGGVEAVMETLQPADADSGQALLSPAVLPAAATEDDDPQGTEALQEQLAQLLHMRQHAESLAERFKGLEQAEQNLPPGAELPEEDMLEALQLMEELKALRTEGTIAATAFADEIPAGAGGAREEDQEWRRHRPPVPLSPPPKPPPSHVLNNPLGEAEEERILFQFAEQDARVAKLREEQTALQAERDRLVAEREARDDSVNERRVQLMELQTQKAKLVALRQRLADVGGSSSAAGDYDEDFEEDSEDADGGSSSSAASRAVAFDVAASAGSAELQEDGIEDAGALDDLERRLDALHAMTSTMQARSDQVEESSEQASILTDVQEKRAMLESLQLQLAQLREMQTDAGMGQDVEGEGAGNNVDNADEDDAADTLGSEDGEVYQPGGSSATPPPGVGEGSVEIPAYLGQMSAMLDALRGAQAGLEAETADGANDNAVVAQYEARLAEHRRLAATLASLKEKKELLQQLKDEEERERSGEQLVDDYASEEDAGVGADSATDGHLDDGDEIANVGEEQVAALLAKLAEQQRTLRALHAMRDGVEGGYEVRPAGLTPSEMADLASDIATLGSAPESASGAAASDYGSSYKHGNSGGTSGGGGGGGMMEELSAIRQYMASINQRLIKIETGSTTPGEELLIHEPRRVPLMVGRAVFTGGPVNAANGAVKPEESVMAEDGSIKAALHGVSVDVDEDVSEVWEDTDGDDVFEDEDDGDVAQMSVQNMKLAVLFSEGLPELERKAFFEDFFEFSADMRTSHMAFQLSMEMANKRKLRLHDGRLQFVEQAAPIDPPPEMVHISAPGRGEIEAIMTHDEIDALKERRWHASGGRGTIASLAATVGSRTMSETGSEYIDNHHGHHQHHQHYRHQHPHAVPAAEEAEEAVEETDAVFAALRSTIYREVAVVIAYNESRPNFLVRFFRLLQCLTSDYIRDRALVLLQELVASVLPDEDEDVDDCAADIHMQERLAAAMDEGSMNYGGDAASAGSMAAMRNLSDLGEMTADDSFMWEEEEQALFKVPAPGNPLVRHRSYDYAETADVGTDIPTPDATEDESAAEYNWVRREDRERASAVSTSEMEMEVEPGAAASLAEEFQQDIEGNQSVLLGVARYLESFSGPNRVLTDAVITNVAEVILKQTTVTSYLQSIGGDQPDVDQLRITLNDSLKKYNGASIESVKADVLRDVGDILYDEMIFYKVISQVDQSYNDEIAGLQQRTGQFEREASQLQSQRTEDISKLLLERQRRLAKIVSESEGSRQTEQKILESQVKESTGSPSVTAVVDDQQVVVDDLPAEFTIPSGEIE